MSERSFKRLRTDPPLDSTHQSVIVGKSKITNNIVQTQRFWPDRYRRIVYPSLILAVDTTGQQVLLGGSYHGSNCFVLSFNISASTEKYDQMLWSMANNDLCRLQFIPNGKNLHAVTSHRGLKIIDTSQQRVISGFSSDDHSSNHWSDWHPNDHNLLANCNELSLDLIDRRQSGLTSALELATYSESDCSNSHMEDGFASSCLWSPKNDNHLIVGNLNSSVVTYDRRNINGRIDNAKVDGYFLSDFQMTPNGKHLFGWCRSNKTLYQWEYDDGNFKQHIDEYTDYRWPIRGYPNFMCQNNQYHVTDSHLYWPVKDATEDYHAVLGVVGSSNGEHESKLYSVNCGMEFITWSVIAPPKPGTPATLPRIRIYVDKSQKFAT